MASGDPVVQVIDVMPLSATFATPGIRSGGSTPAEKHSIWNFDDTTPEYLDFKCVLIGYDGSGLTFRIKWSGNTQTSGVVDWEIGIHRIADDSEDTDLAHTYLFNTVTATTTNVAGEVDYTTITFTDGADMDDWADGELAVVRLRRNSPETSKLVGDAELWALTGEET